MTRETKTLLAQARKVARHAYAPHSGYRVGAAVLTERGGVFTGCNIENSSYGLTQCAERNAVAAAVAAEGAKMRLVRVAVFVEADAPFPPCGACRQVLAEFGGSDVSVAYGGTAGAVVETTLGALLPQGFSL